VNVNSGAKSRLSAILHGCWILLFVLFCKPLLVLIPKAALAALLVYTGYKLVNVKQIKKLTQVGRREVAIYFVTLIGIVVTDLLTGVLLGVGVAAATLLARLSRFEGEQMPSDEGVLHIHLKGCCTFLNLPKVAALLESIPPEADVHFHVDEMDAIDHACLELLDQWEKQREGVGGRLTIDWGEIHSRFHGRLHDEFKEKVRELETAGR
jgi:MFS superfamily sulfate permease-like transporter